MKIFKFVNHLVVNLLQLNFASVSDELRYFVSYAKEEFFLTTFEVYLTSFDAFNDNAL